MPPELPPPYPCNEHEARVVLAIFVAVWGGTLAVLVVQGWRERDVQFIMALVRYLIQRRRARKRQSRR